MTPHIKRVDTAPRETIYNTPHRHTLPANKNHYAWPIHIIVVMTADMNNDIMLLLTRGRLDITLRSILSAMRIARQTWTGPEISTILFPVSP